MTISKRHGSLPGYSILFLFGILFLMIPRSIYAELEAFQGAGFVSEEGEYVSDKFWTNDDNFSVIIEVVTSGGTASFELFYLGMKYVVSCFFQTAVKPLEFYINFLHRWRDETGQRDPEDFRQMTVLMIDKRLDIGWFQMKCAGLMKSEGWNNTFSTPWVTSDPNVLADEVDSQMESMGMGNPVDRGTGSGGLASLRVLPGGAAELGWGSAGSPSPDITMPAKFRASMNVMNNELFQQYVNEAAQNGYWQKSMGIPKGSRYINMSYMLHAKMSKCGPDGFFIDKNGKCYLLEMKWHADGAGALGRPFKKRIVQGSPEWLQKAMLQVRRQDYGRWLQIKNAASGTRLMDLCEAIDLVDEHMDEFLSIPQNSHIAREVVENFADPKITRDLLRIHMPQHQLDRIGKFWAEDFHFGVVNKVGGKPAHIDDVKKGIINSAKAFGGSVKNAAKRVMWAKVK